MPSWGAPAKGANITDSKDLQSPGSHHSFTTDTRGQNRNANRFQRHNPYPNNSPLQNRQDFHSLGGLLPVPKQIQNTEGVSNFSSDNPFMNQTQFSADNPFQNSDPLRSSENPYNNRNNPSPIQHGSPRPSFQPSPLIRTPRGRGQRPGFSPRTPYSSNFYTPPTRFQSPSPRYHTPSNRFQGGFPRGSSSAKRGFGNRGDSFCNPGGSDDIQKYVNPSMLEDPWKDLPATPFLQTY
ncbi:hypothetical protein ElyMa_000778900 [Elysia marginata]|uniref:M-phase-specific PLK1-interacting protein n=1 Tax=Elysia marginata TaxID=1093978 RepID=A0AAV4GU55_9GAST|nr:hypothetical protein ElyMa_000778900 [Elysia marginata]